MPRRKSDREKIAAGTRLVRADRPTIIMTVAEAQAKATEASVDLALGRQKAEQKKPKLTARQKRLAKERIPILESRLECCLEDLARSLKAEQELAAQPNLRPGLELMSYHELVTMTPPLSDAEQLHWLAVGPVDSADLMRRRKAAGLPISAVDVEPSYRDLDYLQHWIASGKPLSREEAAHLAEVQEHIAYFEAQPGAVRSASTSTSTSTSTLTWWGTFIARLQANAAEGFSTEASRKILADYEVKQNEGRQ